MVEVVDSHQHFWNPTLVQIPWLEGTKASFGDPSQIRHLYSPAEYRRDAEPVKIIGSIHVEAAANPDYALTEVAWATGLADAVGLPSGIVAFLDVEHPDIEMKLDLLCRSPAVRGVRMRLNYHEPSGRRMVRSAEIMSEPSFRKGLKAIAARKLVFNVSVFSSQLFAVAELAKAAPEITLALEHFGWPVAADPEAFAAWKSGMAAVAACPNVSVKVSGFWAIDRAWRAEAVEPWLKETYALFGPQRCMFGSNLPIEKLMCPLPRQIEILSNILANELSRDQDDFFCGTAIRVYRLPIQRSN